MTDNTPKDEQAQKEWADLQRDLDTLGQQLGSLRDHTAALGDALVANLEAQFQDVRNRALGFRSATEAQIEDVRKTAVQQAMEAQASMTEAGKDTARQVWERSEPLRQGAQEVGKGFVRAWSELATSFGKAAEKIQTQKAETPAGEESHKSS
jgi:hypothetical protein